MSNTQIIESEQMLLGIEVECHTFQGWKSRGYSVKKGETAAFKTKIWRQVKATKKEQAAGEEEHKMIMVGAAFFTLHQVKPIK